MNNLSNQIHPKIPSKLHRSPGIASDDFSLLTRSQPTLASKGQKLTPSLKLSCYNQQPQQLNLTLSPNSPLWGRQDYLFQINQLLKSQSKLDSLTLIAPKYLSLKNLCTILLQLKNLRGLTKLHIDLKDLDIDQKSLSILIHILKNLSTLTDLTLKLNTTFEIDTLGTWPQKIGQLRNLNRFTIYYTNFAQSFTSKAIYILPQVLSGLHQLPNLKTLNLSSYASKERINQLISQLAKLTQLRTLILLLPNSLNNQHLLQLQNCLPKLSKLSTLVLNICSINSEITDVGLKSILNGIKKLNLMQFHFTSYKQLMDGGLTYMLTTLSEQKNLKILKLILYDNLALSNRAFQQFPTLCKQLPKLSIFVIRINNFDHLDNQGLSYILDGLNQLPQSLTGLTLEFGYSNMNQSVYSQLLQVLAKHINLRTLELKLKKCSYISNKNLEALGTKLAQLSKLTELDIDFAKSEHITRVGINLLQQKLTNLPKLTKIDLTMPDCQ